MNYVVGTVTGPKPTAKPPATTELSKLKADVAKLMKEGTKLWSASSLHLYIVSWYRWLNYNCCNILVSVLQKRLTNTDSSIGSMCSLFDAIYGAGISGLTAKSCCFVTHTENNVGNFMTCQSNTALSAASFFSQGTAGSCDTSTTSCGSLAPE